MIEMNDERERNLFLLHDLMMMMMIYCWMEKSIIRVLALYEMQAAVFRIWTSLTKSTPYNDNCYAKSASNQVLPGKEIITAR